MYNSRLITEVIGNDFTTLSSEENTGKNKKKKKNNDFKGLVRNIKNNNEIFSLG